MKKTTKFLLVLAAVVAMTIGAVSTVMAADVVIDNATWTKDANGNESAKDINGVAIRNGWAQDNVSLQWFFFKNGVMVKNSIITTGKEIYYVGDGGAMHTGWLELKSDKKVAKNGVAGYKNIASIFAKGEEVVPFVTGTTYEKSVWLYFDTNPEHGGAMIQNEWEEIVDDYGNSIWYFFDNAYCVMGDYEFVVKYDEDGKAITDANKQFTYGFNESGAMYADWVAVPHDTTNTTPAQGVASGPNGKPSSTTTTTDYTWTYYGLDGKKAPAGWLKDHKNDWFYLVDDDANKAGAEAIMYTFFTDSDGNEYFFDEKGYMVTTDFVIENTSTTEVKTVDTLKNTGSALEKSTIEVAKGKTVYLTFGSTGKLSAGQASDGTYFEDGKGVKYAVNSKFNETASGSSIIVTVDAHTKTDALKGEQWTEDFLYIVGGVAYYYEGGFMVKDKAITFGDKILAFGTDGKLITGEKALSDGITYIPNANDKLVKDSTLCFSVVK